MLINVKCTYSGFALEVGCDEAGRGCLAGPVVAAAVSLSGEKTPKFIRDSKKLDEKSRTLAAEWVKANAISWAVAEASPSEIDQLNILQASLLAMNRAVESLQIQPDYLLIDGNKFYSRKNIPFSCIVKGDDLIACISAASILAKTERDRIMMELHLEFPCYGWMSNKGYPTPEHRLSVLKHGKSPYHRKSFTVNPPTIGPLFS
ncbi:MAG: ribonuclease HII [Saprospirales bacterium]|nr:MAG: ribonuclease HII [Saprospirales bacterium]